MAPKENFKLLKYEHIIYHCNPPMAKVFQVFLEFFQVFLENGKAFIPNEIFSCCLNLGTSVHENVFQIGVTVLALKLDEGGMLGGGGVATTPWTF